MRYGQFDVARREYVIENPATPKGWINFLGSADYCAIISNNGAGYSFVKGAAGRLTRFRFNNVPMDRPGRYVYIRDEDTGDFWTATWQPVAKPLDQYRTVCRHGLGYTTFESCYGGIQSRMRVFVPLDEPLEVWDVEVENTATTPRNLSLFAYTEWAFWIVDQDMKNMQYVSYIAKMGFDNDTIDFTTDLWPPERKCGFMTSVLPAESFDTDRDVFLGAYRSEQAPQAVEQGRCLGSIARGGMPCGAVQNKLTLAPGERRRACFVIGVGQAGDAGMQAKRYYSDPAAITLELARIRDFWTERLSSYACKSPASEMDISINTWNQYQCHTTFHWSRFNSFIEAGGREGLGFRDSTQDVLGVMHSVPHLVRPRLIDLMKGQFSDGSAMHSVIPHKWKQLDHGRLDASDNPYHWGVFSDDHLWLLLAVPEYIKETNDLELAEHVVPWQDAGEASVYDHLRRAVEFSWGKRGPHGLLLGLTADWNDCLNLRGKGESMFSTFLFMRAVKELAELACRLGRDDDAARMDAYWQEMKSAVDRHAWDGQWFLRGYFDSGKPLGSHASDGTQIFLNSQSWAVLAGAADRNTLLSAMDAVKQHLATEHGCVKSFPAYRDVDLEVGAITTFPPGLKENGGIFCHASSWTVIAEAVLGRGEHAFEHYRSYLPMTKNDTADTWTTEPYVYCQFITGKEHPHFGRAHNPWLTGSASWSLVAATQYILGVRADYDGLRIDPCVPATWEGFEVTRRFRGATYRITVRNPRHVCKGVVRVTVDGRAVTGNVVPPAAAGQTVMVAVDMG